MVWKKRLPRIITVDPNDREDAVEGGRGGTDNRLWSGGRFGRQSSPPTEGRTDAANTAAAASPTAFIAAAALYSPTSTTAPATPDKAAPK